MTRIRIPHRLASDEARARLARIARSNDVLITPAEDGLSGTLEKTVSLLGKVSGHYSIGQDAIEIEVLDAPPMLPPETLERMLMDELGKAFLEPS